jgi:hypothetical protein
LESAGNKPSRLDALLEMGRKRTTQAADLSAAGTENQKVRHTI